MLFSVKPNRYLTDFAAKKSINVLLRQERNDFFRRIAPTRKGSSTRCKRMATSDRRIIQRFPVDFRVDFIHAGDYLISCSRDISMDGMFINTQSPAPVGTHINVIFPVDGSLEMEVAALVVWNREKSSSARPGMGVQFLSSLPHAVKKNFLKHIDRIVILREKGVSA